MSALDFGAGTQANTSRSYYFSSSGLSLPDGDWCIGCWIRARATFGNTYAHAISHTNASTTETVRMSGWDTDYLASVTRGAGATFARTIPGSGWAIPKDNTAILFLTQRNGSNDEVYLIHKGSAVSAPTASDTHQGTSIAAPTEWRIGRGWSGGDRWTDHLGEVFFYNNRALTAAQVQTLAAGARPSVGTVGADPLVLLPFRDGGVSTETNLGTGGATYNASIVGSGFTTGDDFFPLTGGSGFIGNFMFRVAEQIMGEVRGAWAKTSWGFLIPGAPIPAQQLAGN
jgi:hypothetical protein